jgi:hypothetical protein
MPTLSLRSEDKSMNEPREPSKRRGAGFFHIDRRTWKLLCGRGDIKEAAVYLTLACGTGAGNRVTAWSANSVEKYTGLHSNRARDAIAALVKSGFICRTADHKKFRPIYDLLPFEAAHEVAVAVAEEKFGMLYKYLTDSTSPRKLAQDEREEANSLVLRGVL